MDCHRNSLHLIPMKRAQADFVDCHRNSATIPRYDDLDAIGKSEFGGIVEQMLKAAAAARIEEPDSK